MFEPETLTLMLSLDSYHYKWFLFNLSEPPPIRPVHNPYAIERPHATPQLLQRQGSFRGFSELNHQASPFKRQLSLRLPELPSNFERQRSQSLQSSNTFLHPKEKSTVAPIPETSPEIEIKSDTISEMCKEISQGLSFLTNKTDDIFYSFDSLNKANKFCSKFDSNNFNGKWIWD